MFLAILLFCCILCGLFWIGFYLTGALILALVWVCIKLPLALILLAFVFACCCTLILIPLGIGILKAGMRMLLPV